MPRKLNNRELAKWSFSMKVALIINILFAILNITIGVIAQKYSAFSFFCGGISLGVAIMLISDLLKKRG